MGNIIANENKFDYEYQNGLVLWFIPMARAPKQEWSEVRLEIIYGN